jgi:predicted dehydrogenase
MTLYLSPEQKKTGQENFQQAVGQRGWTRRDFMKGLLAAGAALPVSAAAYYGYQQLRGNPVRAGLIGGGDEGGVLVGMHNPDYLKFIAVADIRPSNRKRIFTGEPTGPRLGFNKIYGKDAEKDIKVYDNYKELLENKDVEAVVIALPLHLHAQVAMDALRAGKHVLCEKLMAWNVPQCKDMIKASDETDRILTIGHQRHYSLLYAHGVELINSGELGDVRHIRALWHRNNTWPRLDASGKEIVVDGYPVLRDGWHPEIPKEDREALEAKIRQLGYKSMNELVRWRLYNRTGGGLMAELGSHQLDACSIFLGKVHPLAVSGVGTKSFYRHEYETGDREVDDHVFVSFEFPGPDYFEKDDNGKPTGKVKDKDSVVVVTYSSINTNSFEPYGECVMGDRATMVVENEQSIMLFPERNPNQKAGEDKPTGVTVASTGGGKPTVDSTATTGALAPSKAQERGADALGPVPVSRGYREEMEHFAYCIRMHDKAEGKEEKETWRHTPRCHGRVAMADAIIALTSNLAMRHRQRIEFQPEWFEAENPAVPDAENKPEIIS